MAKYALGDIVTLLTHPYSESNTHVIISGEHLLTPPTMVIIEIIAREVPTQDNPDSYKCVWFSSKKNDFPQHWFVERELKKMDVTSEVAKISVGCLVSLKNLRLELGKRRSFLQIDTQGSSEIKRTSSISAHLPFISPVMLVCAMEPFNEKKLKKGISLKEKIFPANWVKCKYYNAFSEKFSEVILPAESLAVVPKVNDDVLKNIGELIETAAYMLFEDTIIKPVNVFNKSGLYFMTGFDLVSQKYKDLDLHTLPDFTGIREPLIETAPKFSIEEFEGTKQLVAKKDVKTMIKEMIDTNDRNYLLIRYVDNYGNLTKRTLDNFELVTGPDDLDPARTIEYLSGYCNLRKAPRNFKLSSIQEASKLNLASGIKT